jgi:hypothetical protein
MYNFKTKVEENLTLEDLMKFYQQNGFEFYTKIYSLDEKLKRKLEKETNV